MPLFRKLFLFMRTTTLLLLGAFVYLPIFSVIAGDISELISKEEFLQYKDVGEFIDGAPKVTITVPVEQNDIEKYGQGVVKTLTGSDCDRDGKMDDNPTCNAVYYKLWLKYCLEKSKSKNIAGKNDE